MKNPIALILSDCHINDTNTELITDIFKQAIEQATTADIKYIIIAGDVFTSRKGQTVKTLNAFLNIRNMLRDSKTITTHVIAGNHDKANQEAPESFLDVFHSNDHRFIVHQSFGKIEIEGVTISMLSYFPENSNYVDFLKEVGKSQILITHIAVNGVVNNDGSKVTNAIPKSKFDGFEKVLIGHYHDRSNFSNIYYTGSTHQSNFGENEDKGFTVLFKDLSHSHIQTKFPRYIKKEISYSKYVKNPDDTVREIQAGASDCDKIRVTIVGPEAKIKALDLSKLTSEGIQVKKDTLELAKQIKSASNNEIVRYNSKVIKEQFPKFCSEIEISSISKAVGEQYINML